MRKFIILLAFFIFLGARSIGQRNPELPTPVPDSPSDPSGFRGADPSLNAEEVDTSDSLVSRFDAVVATYTDLQAQITSANAQPGIEHLIRVRPGTYTFDPPAGILYDLQILDDITVTIQGETATGLPADPNSVIFERAATDTRSFSLFRVEKRGKLVLRNVKLANGGGPLSGLEGGAVRVSGESGAAEGGNLHIYDSKIVNNATTGKGGAIFLGYYASIRITNVDFFGNEASQGGAIYARANSSIVVDDGSFGFVCTSFQFNKANNGGAIFSSASTLNLDRSVFQYNTAYNALGYYDAYQDVAGGTARAYYNMIRSPNNGTLPESMGGIDLGLGGGTPPVPPPALEPFDCDSKISLGYFGVTWNASWTPNDLEDIRKGVAITGTVFGKYMSPIEPAVTAFRRVFLDNNPLGWPDIRLERVSGSTPECVTTARLIQCSNAVDLTKFTVVHELGHVFTVRTGGTQQGTDKFFGRMNSPTNPSCPNASADIVLDYYCVELIFGKRVINNQTDWARGQQGWGSAPLPLPNPSNFQQHPFEIIDASGTVADRTKEVDEAAADMFLNWIFNRMSKGGFLNTDWRQSEGCYPNGCPDPGLAGTSRSVWMHENISALFSIYGWN